ncbi:hypothetical protein B296_00025309 [Ensete ventricosum]|uniref:Uncharacterized protein n=1 Tax=Ensete ventricosum TaxID=4639 RepID=A0A427A872_ENSVE|nr:hypothetical protein B296_00025309 [Ensete ventricosum]
MAGIQVAFVNRRPSSSSSSPDGTPRAGEVTDGLPVQEVMDAWETGSAKARVRVAWFPIFLRNGLFTCSQETHSDDGMVKGLVQGDISPFLVLCSSAASTAVALAASKRGEEGEGRMEGETEGGSGGGAESVLNLVPGSSVPIRYHSLFGAHDDFLLLEAAEALLPDILHSR